MEDRIYYYMYQITNLVNGKIYIGVHKTIDLSDGYMGSGSFIRQAIKKHGIQNFEKKILEFFESQEEMYFRESEVVTIAFINADKNYNAKVGGFGGGSFSMEVQARANEKKKGRRWYHNPKDDSHLLWKPGDEIPPEPWILGRPRYITERSHSKEASKKRSETSKRISSNKSIETKKQTAESVSKIWAERSDERKKEIAKKISETLKKRKKNEATGNDPKNIEN